MGISIGGSVQVVPAMKYSTSSILTAANNAVSITDLDTNTDLIAAKTIIIEFSGKHLWGSAAAGTIAFTDSAGNACTINTERIAALAAGLSAAENSSSFTIPNMQTDDIAIHRYIIRKATTADTFIIEAQLGYSAALYLHTGYFTTTAGSVLKTITYTMTGADRTWDIGTGFKVYYMGD